MSGTQRQIIDLNLPNVSKHEAERAYYRAAHLLRRRVLLQEWAEFFPADADGPGELIIGRCRAGVHSRRNAEWATTPDKKERQQYSDHALW